MELRDYLRVIRRRWIWIVASVVITTGVAGLVTLQTATTYEAKARVFISSLDESETTSLQGNLFSIQLVESYAELVTSKELATRVIDDLGLEETPEALSSRLSGSVPPETVIVEITAGDADPEQARDIATSAGEQLTEFVDELETPPGGGSAPVKATVVDPAGLPESPASPQPVRNLGLGLVLGLLLGLGLAVMRETLDAQSSAVPTETA